MKFWRSNGGPVHVTIMRWPKVFNSYYHRGGYISIDFLFWELLVESLVQPRQNHRAARRHSIDMPDAPAQRICGLVLSLFPGAGLLDAGFTQAGFAVVRGPDTLLGQDIRTLTLAGINGSPFDGIIAGPPCQDFSRARRRPPSGYGLAMLEELARLITEAEPEWFLVENVPGVPTLVFQGYTNQRFNLFASDYGLPHKRNRSFQFGSRSGGALTVPRGTQSQWRSLRLKPTPLASRAGKRNFADHCELMGLPRGFTLPGLSRRAQFQVVGNGVPLPMAFAVARAIRDRQITRNPRPCPCSCGRRLTGKHKSATVACRKRLQRERENKGPTTRIFTGRVTELLEQSHIGKKHAGEVTDA